MAQHQALNAAIINNHYFRLNCHFGGSTMLTRHELANAIRALSMDAVQRANSGHPGAPMGMADIAEVCGMIF